MVKKVTTLQLDRLVIAANGSTQSAPLDQRCQSGQLWRVTGGDAPLQRACLRTIAARQRPSGGRVLLNGQPLVRAQALWLPVHGGFWPFLRVRDQLRLWSRFAGEPMLLPAAIHYFDLEPLLAQRVSALPAQSLRRVMLSRLILIPALIWCLEDPTEGLDDSTLELLQPLIASRRAQGGVVFLTSQRPVAGESVHTLELQPDSAK